MADAPKTVPTLIERRKILQMGAAGVAALGVGGVELVGRADQTPGSGQGQQPPRPPAPDLVVDIGTLPEENWTEPWVWRPSDWPGQPLVLNVVGNQHPPQPTSSGNRFTPLFSFNGSSPGPTIRMRGDEPLKVTVRNFLGPNFGRVPKGAFPDLLEMRPDKLGAAVCRILTAEGLDCATPPTTRMIISRFDELFADIPVEMADTTCVSGPVNGPHAAHTTNLHTHGVHVNPGVNANGTFGDNTLSRIIPRADWQARQSSAGACRTLGPYERVAEGEYEYDLGNVQRAHARPGSPPQPHPPGTHWYHPHSHGATHDQVASGMAGFLIIEGDVDEAINQAMTGTPRPDPGQKTGPYDYRERLMMIQRVEVRSIDADAGPRRMQARFSPPTAINGGFQPAAMFMRPGAVERWRVLNGSVDGRGFKHLMVLEGQYVFNDRQLWKVLPGENPAGGPGSGTGGGGGTGGGAGAAGQPPPPRMVPVSREDIANATRQIYHLASDGITLVEDVNGQARYTIRDLAEQNPGSRCPLDRPLPAGEDPSAAMLRNVEDCYRDAAGIRSLFAQPNRLLMINATRADILFKAPVDAAGKVYTVFAQEFPLGTDNFQQRLQIGVASGRSGFLPANPPPIDVVVGYIKVQGTPVPGGDFNVMSLRDALPPVPPFLRPVQDEELRVPQEEATARRVPAGSFRSRVISYSGYGPTDFPLIEIPEAAARPELQGRLWDEINGAKVLLAPGLRTMAINGSFDLARTPTPPLPEKFGHHTESCPRPLVDTSEEWVLYNCSVALWSQTNKDKLAQPGQYNTHYRAFPIGRAEGQARFAKDHDFQITTKGADHPFHIHVNPCWVTRIEVPDEQGRLHNILDAPVWLDTIAIPRGGRVVFRSRFADYVGTWVNHCHILQHEDNGMMQPVECVAKPEDANYNPRTRVASHAMPAEAVSQIYPAPSLELMYRQNLSFIDPSPETGQQYPGFELEIPKLTES